MSKSRFFLELGYDGTQYHGWQKQPDAITVQSKLEEGLSLILRDQIQVTAAGRTDAGVHARQMLVHLDLEEDQLIDNFIFKINRWLPADIAVYNITPVQEDAHARFHATARSYEYHFHLRPDPFEAQRSYILHRLPDVSLMQEAATVLLDYKDFECFSRTHTDVKTYLCDIREARFEQHDHHLVFHIAADRFLRNMVRAIVGTLLEIGYKKIPVTAMHDIIKSKNRSEAGASAPAHGLYLTNIAYPETIWKTN